MKPAANAAHFDNIATPGHPVWRKRMSKPFTCRAVRQQLITQAADLPLEERLLYVRRRVTELDRALSDEEADAIEEWLDCEEIRSGRVKIGDYGDGSGGGSGRSSPVPDWAIAMLRDHARHRGRLPGGELDALGLLAAMMEAPHWDFGHAGQRLFKGLSYARGKRFFISSLQSAAARLVNLRGGARK